MSRVFEHMTPEEKREARTATIGKIYVASRATPERASMWRDFRDRGWPIVSTWIDLVGKSHINHPQLWDTITREVRAASKVVLYAERIDFPMKGALIEAGMALGMGKHVVLCLPNVYLSSNTQDPIGSWAFHHCVYRVDCLVDALAWHIEKKP